MKLLFETDDPQEIDRVKFELESNGIPTFIGNENTGRNLQYVGPNAKLTLWVFIPEQLEDAQLLLNDPEYEVKNKVDVQVFYSNLERQKKKSAHNFMDKFMLFIVVTAISAFSLYVYITVGT